MMLSQPLIDSIVAEIMTVLLINNTMPEEDSFSFVFSLSSMLYLMFVKAPRLSTKSLRA